MNTASRDIYINNLNKIIQDRKNLLLENYKEINKNINKNDILTDVAEEYKMYFLNYLKECEALSKLSDYIDTIASDNVNNKHMINELKKEQNIIFREIKNIENKMKI